jgi:hypothetical protein
MLTPIKDVSKLEQLIRALICVEGLYYASGEEENPTLDKIYEIVHGVLGCGPKQNCPIVRDFAKNIETTEEFLDKANIIKKEHIKEIINQQKQEVYNDLQNTKYGT